MDEEQAKRFIADLHLGMENSPKDYDTREVCGYDETKIVRWTLFELSDSYTL